MANEKRKKVVVSIEQKLEGLKRLDKGESVRKIASEYGVGRVTVGDWKRNRSELEKWCANRTLSEDLKYRKTMKKHEYEKVSEALYIWFSQQREKGRAITGLMLKEKARIFQKNLNEGELSFTASIGWLQGWKKRYGISHFNMGSRKKSNNEITKSKLQYIINSKQLTNDQIYNCNETSLNFKMLPLKTLTTLNETDTVAILACCNATGNHKLELAVSYKTQKNLWMNSDIFRDWFFNEFVPSVKQFLKSKNLPIEAILVVDKLPTCLNVDELVCGDIRVLFLPRKANLLCQPMHEALNDLKTKYRQKLLTALIVPANNGDGLMEKLRDVRLKDVISWIMQSWEEIKTETLVLFWEKFLLEDLTVEQQKTDVLLPLLQQIPGCKFMTSQDVDDWMKSDQPEELTDEEILTFVNQNVEKTNEQETEQQVKRTKLISHSKGARALEVALSYIEQQEEATDSDILLLKRWCDIADKKRTTTRKNCPTTRACSK